MPTIYMDAIDRQDKVPVYRQIAEQIRLQISSGQMPHGTQLPTVRELAKLLGVTRLTVQNAYRDLQSGGWIESTVGRGTFVAVEADMRTITDMMSHQASPDQVMHDINRVSRLAGMRSMAYAEPDPALYPTDDFMRFFQHPSALDASLMQYGSPQGDEMLRVELTKLVAMRHVAATPDDIVITSGVSGALSLLTTCLTRPGDSVIVEQPVYLGMLHVLNSFGVTPIGVPLDCEGLQLEVLEQAIREHHPRFIYTVTNFQNPTGYSTSTQRKRDLLELASRYDVLIIEDDIYGLLSYDSEPALPLKAMDTDNRVIYVSSVSKILLPGLRIGYLIPPRQLRERVVLIRQAMDVSSPLMLQRALANYLHRGRLKPHLEKVVARYRDSRDELVNALALKMPGYVRWTRPGGGFSCWLTLPAECAPADLYQKALRHGIAFTPGDAFLVEPDHEFHMRLSFSALSPALIREAITILGSLLSEPLAPPYQLNRMLHNAPLV